MALIEDFEKQGSFLFRWRTYVPSVIIILSFFYIADNRYPEGKYSFHLIYAGICFLVSLFGLFIRSFTIGYAPENTSGRNTKKQVADTVNQTGIYSLIRHPLYVGNFFMFLGIVLFCRSISFTLVFILFYWFYYERIMFTEEQFLRSKFGAKYLIWANKTPAILPILSNYKSPNLEFSFKNVLKREYPSLFGIIIMFLIYDLIFIYFNEPERGKEGLLNLIKVHHICIFGSNLAFYVIVRVIVKFTRILHVDGR